MVDAASVVPIGGVLAFAPVFAAPFIGSFLGLIVRRLPIGGRIVAGRSACAHCGRALSPVELVPVVSWLLQGGKCLNCGAQLGVFYPAIELAATTVALPAVLLTDGPSSAWLACGLGWTLLCLSWIDAETMLLPDILTLPLLLAGLALSLSGITVTMLSAGIGAALGFGTLWLVGRSYRALARKPGLGEGDIKLFAAAGAWLGWQILPMVIFLASVLGIAAALVAMAMGRKMTRETRIPFGPFIAAATWLGFLAEHPGDGVAAVIATMAGL